MVTLLLPLVLALPQVSGPSVALESARGALRVRDAAFAARLDADGLAFGGSDAAPALTLTATELRRGATRVALVAGAPIAIDGRAEYGRAPGVVERFEPTETGIEHSLVVDGPVGTNGDLVVRVALGGANAALGERLSDGSHSFGDVEYGRLFGIDADGDRCDGDVRLVDGGLELVLPSEFVATAEWPITLDPLISSSNVITTPGVVAASGLGSSDHEPDCAYDATTGWFLHVWRRRTVEEVVGPLGTTQVVTRDRVMYQRLNSIGSPVGTALEISTNNSYRPRIASVNRFDTFAVTWLEDVGDETRLMFRAYNASTGVATGSAIVIATDDTAEIDYHDVVGESSPSPFVSGRAFVVWINGAGALQLTRVNASSGSAPTIADTTTIAADPGIFDSWSSVSAARCTNSEGRFVVAMVRHGSLTGSKRVVAMCVDRNATVITAPTTVSGSDVQVSSPTVDGGGAAPSRWVVAWDDGETTPFGAAYDLRATTLQGAPTPTNTLTAAPVVTLTSTAVETRPSVGWRPGMGIVTYEIGLSVSVQMVCDDGATVGELPSAVFLGSSSFFLTEDGNRPVVALRTSGGDTSEHEGVILWQRFDSDFMGTSSGVISRHRYDAFDPNATTSILAFGCGNAGAIGVPTPPAIGNPEFRIELSGAKPGAAIAILNIAAPQQLSTCGSCTFATLTTLYIHPIVAGGAVQNLPLPCNPSLAGAQADVQWIVYEPGIAPCAPFPDFGATGLLRLTVN